MGRYVSLACLALAIATTPTAASALDLNASSEWKLREYDDKCRMSRSFGEGEDKVTLWIEKASEGQFVNMTAIGRPFRSPYGPRVNLSFEPGEPVYRGFITSTSSAGRPVISMFGVAPISFAKEPAEDTEEETVDLLSDEPVIAAPEVLAERYGAIRSIDLSGALIEKVSLRTGGLGEMMARLNGCVDALPERRVAPTDLSAGLARGATTSGEREWAGQIQMNYPAHLLRENGQGTVGVRIQVNPEGRASYCEVTGHTGPAGLNDAACLGMMRYARFHPALDAAGNPTWGGYEVKVTYRIN